MQAQPPPRSLGFDYAVGICRWFAVLVPMAYVGVYLIGTILADRTWRDWIIALGALLWAGVCGFGLSLVATARRVA